ncbi:MAG TPA: relaxase domain-containing protein [Acidimicrobiales bacterium]|nr:relaxase domain-containing protein [Acidimicrobiales bacterium]
MAPSGWRYYAEEVALGLEDYFTGRGEAPGHWTGSGAAGLGLAGQVDPTHLAALFGQGRDPLTEDALGRPFDHRAGSEVVAGYSLSLSPPNPHLSASRFGRPGASAKRPSW